MALAIDRSTYDKAREYKPGHGYNARPGGTPPRAILVHATHGHKGSAFASEAEFLFTSADVSAHYLIGKQGQCVEFLSPAPWAAWHAGDCAPNLFENASSIGIELHAATTEALTDRQLLSLKALVHHLMWQFQIGRDRVARHGTVAVFPAGHPRAGQFGRKTDPATWPEPQFAIWRAHLVPMQATFAPALAPSTPVPILIDPWQRWGALFPLPPEQRGWAIPQLWLANAAWLGAARAAEIRLHPQIAYRLFQGGAIRYEQLVDTAYLERFTKGLA